MLSKSRIFRLFVFLRKTSMPQAVPEEKDEEKYDDDKATSAGYKSLRISSSKGNSILQSKTPSHYAVEMTSQSQSMGLSVNSDTLPTISADGTVMIEEVGRMRVLKRGLYVCMFVFILNVLWNLFRLLVLLNVIDLEEWKWFEWKSNDELYGNVYIVTFVYFSQWVVINGFVMKFSWIPKSQLINNDE